MNTWIWRSNLNIWKYVKSLIFCKFVGFGLQLYYLRTPSHVLRKDKDYTLHNFLRIFRATTLRNNFAASLYISYISSKMEDSCPASTCKIKVSNTKTIQKLWNVYKGYNKDNGASSLDVVLVSLLLTFNICIVYRLVVSWYFCRFCWADIYLFKFNSRNTRTLDVESVPS